MSCPHPCGIPKGLPLRSRYPGFRSLQVPFLAPIIFPSTERVLQAVWGGAPEPVPFLPKPCWLTGKSLRRELAHFWEKASWDRREVTEIEDQHCSTPAESTGGEPAALSLKLGRGLNFSQDSIHSQESVSSPGCSGSWKEGWSDRAAWASPQPDHTDHTVCFENPLNHNQNACLSNWCLWWNWVLEKWWDIAL